MVATGGISACDVKDGNVREYQVFHAVCFLYPTFPSSDSVGVTSARSYAILDCAPMIVTARPNFGIGSARVNYKNRIVGSVDIPIHPIVFWINRDESPRGGLIVAGAEVLEVRGGFIVVAQVADIPEGISGAARARQYAEGLEPVRVSYSLVSVS